MAQENFPVGSVLIRADLRAAVHAFHRFARAADDVADDPAAPPRRRLAALAVLAAGLDDAPGGAAEGRALADALRRLGKPGLVAHARTLLRAFRQDAAGGHVATWDDLLASCAWSADPVGRFLLDLHDEPAAAIGPSDALCTALQILDHLQDLRADARMGRVYLPGTVLRAAGAGPGDLSRGRLTPAARRAVDATLDRVDALLDRADGLPDVLVSRRLAGEARAIHHLARALLGRLRRDDPLARRVAPGRRDALRAFAAGLVRALAPAGAAAPRRA